jgi:hypothetical protein
MTRILLNHVYYSPVGHVVDALQYAKGFSAANPGSEVHVAISDGAPWELLDRCPWIAGVYRIPLGDPELCDLSIPEMPKDWDYIVDNNLMQLEAESPALIGRPDDLVQPSGWEEGATIAYLDRTATELTAHRGRGVLFPAMSLPAGLGYARDPTVRIDVPQASRDFARQYAGPGPKIAILPAGSGPARQYPRAESWIAIIGALLDRFPSARVFVTGASSSGRHRHLTTTSYRHAALGRILRASPRVTSCYDIGLWNQIALLAECDLLISPHSGFSFLALCVGTPWLAISGGNWPEYFFNDVPFCSVLPDNPDYPYEGAIDGEDGPIIPDMRPEKLLARIPEIVDGAAFLLDPAITYADARRRHLAMIASSVVRRDRLPAPPGYDG